MLDFIGTVVTATLMVFAVNVVIVFMDISRFAKLALALAIGLWIGLSAAAGAAGMIAISKRNFCCSAAFRGGDRNELARRAQRNVECADAADDWPQYRSHFCGVVFPAGG